MLQKMKAVMRIVEKMAREKNVWIEKRNGWDCVKVTKMWDTIYPEFESLYCQTKRKKQINYATVYIQEDDRS